MREIKFRAWHKKDKFMYPQRELSLGEFFGHGCHPIAAWELMQFTGLHDKNGKEIYEGDVVVWVDISGSGRELAYPPRVVKWYRDTCNYNVSTPVAERTIEVIGNIHENPELLEK